MNSYKDAYRHRDIYVDLYLMMQPWNDDIIREIDNYDDWDPLDDETYEEGVSAALTVLLKEKLVDVYWTEDDRFYLEDSTIR